MELKCCFVTLVLLSSLLFVSSQLDVEEPSKETGNEILSESIQDVGLKDWILERLIRRALEAFKKLMKKGDPKRNIPILDPMFSAKDTATFNDSSGVFNFYMESENVTTVGLSDFSINSVSASMFRLTADLDLTFNSIVRKGNYNVKASLFNDIHLLYGQGPFEESVTNLNVLIHMVFGLSFKKLYVKDLDLRYNLEGGAIQLKGLLDNSKLGQTVSEIFTGGAANFANKRRSKIQPQVSSAARSRVSRLVDGMTLTELIQFLQALIDA